MRYRSPREVADYYADNVNDMSSWYIDRMLYSGPISTYGMIGLTFYGAGFLAGKYIAGTGVGGRVGAMAAGAVWRDMQVGAFFYAARHASTLAIIPSAIAANEVMKLPSTIYQGTVDTSEIGYSGSGAYSITGGSDWTPLDWISWIWD